MMKVVLINPSATTELEGSWVPLGLLYIGNMLVENGVNVNILDNGVEQLNEDELVKRIINKEPDVVGFTTMTVTALESNKIAQAVKDELKNVKIVYGGYHATINHTRILENHNFIDIIVRGEGEYSILELIDALEKNHSLEGIRGITFRENGRIHVNPEREFIKDLDAIPIPNRDLIPYEYTCMFNGIKTAVRKFTSIISSRGCPYSCRFCCAPSYWKRRYRQRSPENIVEELLYLESKGFGQLFFVDDNFGLNYKNLIKLCQLMRKEKLDLYWAAETRVNAVRKKAFLEMQKSGCTSVYYGIESGVPRILEYYNKQITPPMVERAVKIAKECDFDIIGAFILGAPTETLSEMQQTIKFADKLNLDFPCLYVLGASPGTSIWEELVEKGYIDEDIFWEKGILVPDVHPKTVPTKIIQRLIKNSYIHWFIRPKYIARQITRFLSPRNSYRRALLKTGLSFSNIPKIFRYYREISSITKN